MAFSMDTLFDDLKKFIDADDSTQLEELLEGLTDAIKPLVSHDAAHLLGKLRKLYFQKSLTTQVMPMIKFFAEHWDYRFVHDTTEDFNCVLETRNIKTLDIVYPYIARQDFRRFMNGNSKLLRDIISEDFIFTQHLLQKANHLKEAPTYYHGLLKSAIGLDNNSLKTVRFLLSEALHPLYTRRVVMAEDFHILRALVEKGRVRTALLVFAYIPSSMREEALNKIAINSTSDNAVYFCKFLNTRIVRAFLGTLTDTDKKDLEAQGVSSTLWESALCSDDLDTIFELYEKATPSLWLDLLFSFEKRPSVLSPLSAQSLKPNPDLPNELRTKIFKQYFDDFPFECPAPKLDDFEQGLALRHGSYPGTKAKEQPLPSIKTTKNIGDAGLLLSRIILQQLVRTARKPLEENQERTTSKHLEEQLAQAKEKSAALESKVKFLEILVKHPEKPTQKHSHRRALSFDSTTAQTRH